MSIKKMKDIPPFIQSLHRPFSQQLKACRWVCLFARENQAETPSFNIGFYLYMVKKLEKEYKKIHKDESNGLPSREGIIVISKEFRGKTDEEKITVLKKALNNTERSLPIERQLYSSYKAASYYVNMTRDKLNLITKENEINAEGDRLLSLSASFLKLSDKEKFFFFNKLLEFDFLLIISLCFFKKLDYEYELKEYANYQYDFLSKFYKIRYFKFTSKSLSNYNTVRNYWLESLGVLDKKMTIKKAYLYQIEADPKYNDWHMSMNKLFGIYKKENFKQIRIYQTESKKFEIQYNKCLKEGKDDSGFVNLYDIKLVMKMSYERFQSFIETFYETEKGSKRIFFSNIVNSIDRRKRFEVRGTPVLKIKLK